MYRQRFSGNGYSLALRLETDATIAGFLDPETARRLTEF